MQYNIDDKTNNKAIYSAIENGYQLWIPLNRGIRIFEDDLVRLLIAMAERIDYREIEAAYFRHDKVEHLTEDLHKGYHL